MYNMKENGNGYVCTKFDEDLNPIDGSSYHVSLDKCNCKAGRRETCRHRQMLPVFQHLGRVNTRWFHDFENDGWYFLDYEKGLVPETRVKGWWRRA